MNVYKGREEQRLEQGLKKGLNVKVRGELGNNQTGGVGAREGALRRNCEI